MHHVWFDDAREHFWRVPADVVLPPGDTPVHCLDGRSASVDVAGMGVWGISRGQARKATVGELGDAARHAGRALGSVAQDWLGQAAEQIPDELHQGRETVERTARQARDTLRRAGRVASSAARSARAVGRVVIENPELVERASKLAEVLVRGTTRDPKDDPDRS